MNLKYQTRKAKLIRQLANTVPNFAMRLGEVQAIELRLHELLSMNLIQKKIASCTTGDRMNICP